VPRPAERGGFGWWWLIPVVLLGAGGAWAFLRRPKAEAVPEIVPPRPVNDPAPERESAAAPAPAIAEKAGGAPLGLLLEAERMSVSLVNATLHYRLTVTNQSGAALGPVAIAADMIGAHASLSPESQLGQDGTGLELRHELPALEPGASAEVKGDLRLPLTEVTPIRAGTATLLVPLVRLRAEAAGISLTQAVVVGEMPLAPGGALRPFRLDTGPRIFGAVSQREIARAA
jgi:hypothetical protein